MNARTVPNADVAHNTSVEAKKTLDSFLRCAVLDTPE